MKIPNPEEKNKEKDKHSSPSKMRGLISAFAIIVAITVIACAVLVAVASSYSDVVYPNTYLAGTDISGLDHKDMMNFPYLLSEEKISGAVIPLSCNTNTIDLNVDDLDIEYNQEETANIALSSGKDGNFISNTVSFVKRWFVSENLEPVFIYNTDVMETALNTVTEGFEVEPVGHTFEIGDDSVTIHAPAVGIKVDRNVATSAILKRIYTYNFSTLSLVLTEIHPEELDFEDFYTWLTSNAQNAYYEKKDGTVTVINSKPKCKVDKQATKSAIDSLKNSGDSKVTIPAEITQPEQTTKKLTELLYKDVLGSYSTYFGSSTAARANNVRLAASRVNGTELMPGEEFSYDKTILPRTPANGYMTAGVYVGNKVESGLGGGICQPSSTLYAAALYANLEILERHNHSLPVSYLPAGLDATIAEGYLDLRIKNNTNYPVKISAITEGGTLTFKILGYNENNTSVDIERSFSGGRYYVTRVVKENGVVIRREAMTSSVYGEPEKDEEEEKPEEEEKTDEGEETPGEETPGEESQAPADEQPPTGEEAPPTTETPTSPAPTPTPAPVPAPESAPVPSPSVSE